MKVLHKRNWALWSAAVLFCLVLISTSMNSGIYARFRTFVAGNDSARVAAFSVDAETTPDSSRENAYTISYKNDSEVSVAYTLEITLQQNAGQVTAVQLYKGSEMKTGHLVENKVTFKDVGSLAPGGSTGELKIAFVTDGSAEGSADAPDFDNETVRSAESTIPFTVSVVFTQIN